MAAHRVARMSGELIGRFTRTPFAICFSLTGRTLRLETNSPTILNRTRQLVKRCGTVSSRPPEFVWRVVSDPDAKSEHDWSRAMGMFDGKLRYASFGQCNFIAADLEEREGVAFLAGESAMNEIDFHNLFFRVLFALSAEDAELAARKFPKHPA
jgi:hypothetical protein